MTIEKFDSVIIGGGLSGLTAAYVLSEYGMNSILIETSESLGGGNSSFRIGKDNIFDKGYHALDYMRSEIVTRLFDKVVDKKCHVIELNRAIVIKNYVIPYNASLEEWPDDLKKLFDIKSDVDSISDVLSREDIAKTYGNKFTNFVFNDILKSYPSQKWSMENGGSEEKNAGMVYPWFFPKLNRGSIRSTETNSYHDNVRKKGVQCIMYPNDNGFEGFMKGLHESINEKYCEIKVGAKELEYKFKDNGVELDSIVCEGRNITADHFFWCAPPAQLLKMFNKLNIQGKPQKIVLGSFVVENEIQHQYHEILVGSSEHNINRISFPGLIGQRENKQVQVEFYFPNGEYPEDEKYWFEIWQESLLKLKLLEPNNKIIEKDFKIEFRGFVTKDDLQETTERSMDVLGEVGTNIAIPYFNFGPENINRVVPGVINNITRIISEKK
jgi:protoporphyrinogen oxidase